MNMKTKNIIWAIFCFMLLAIFSSCEDYLEKKEDEPMTFDKIWTKRTYIERYYGTIWSFIQKDDDIEDGHPFIAAADDAILSFNRDYRKINNGTWSPSNIPYGGYINNSDPNHADYYVYRSGWSRYYQGIREANVFLLNIDNCSDPDVKAEDIKQMKAEIRFVRAYLYFCLYRQYGPFIIIGDEPVDFQQGTFRAPRNTLEECEAYIETELQAIANDGLLTNISDSDTGNLGKPTKGAALALRSRLKLYAARPLFNGNSLYTSVQNQDGTPLFPSSPNASKWQQAAAAARDLISYAESNGNIYQLYEEGSPSTNLKDACKSYQNVFLKNWNKELIFARYGGGFDLRVLLTPGVVGGTCYGGCGPTQQMVDTYAMDNGIYPITGYNQDGSPIIDSRSGYNTNELSASNFTHPIDTRGSALSTRNMYIDREARFYVSVLWSDAWWPNTSTANKPVFAHGGNSGIPRNDYPPSGYMTRKYIDPALNSAATNGWGSITFPVIRLAEIYLNYAEALNESNPSSPDLYTYLNKVRARAGLKKIEEAYPEVANGANPTKMRELIQRERQIELFFECHRYFDVRQWMQGEKLRGPVYGMNIMANTTNANVTPADFWKRTVTEQRVFEPKHYLFPMHQSEIDRNPEIVQNYGW